MLSLMRQVILRPGEDGWWVAEVPSLPGCVSQGKTQDEALANVREAIEGWIETATEHSLAVPVDTLSASIVVVPS